MEEKQRPVAKFTAHPVEAAVWQNERVVNGARVVEYAVTVATTYKDASGALRSARSFRVEELPHALCALAQAYAVLLNQQLAKEGDEEEDEVEEVEE